MAQTLLEGAKKYWKTSNGFKQGKRYIEISTDEVYGSLEEKPNQPKSSYAVPGLYFYDNSIIEIAKSITPSSRGELEVTDVNKVYLERGKLSVKVLGRGFAWFDTGTHDSLLEANNFVQAIQKRPGLYIACVEEIAYKKGFIGKEQLYLLAQYSMSTEYGKYLMQIYQEKNS